MLTAVSWMMWDQDGGHKMRARDLFLHKGLPVRTEAVVDKTAFILSAVAGRRCLDLGCVNHDLGLRGRADWLHGEIVRVASRVVGVDIIPGAVESLRAEGYEVVCADVQEMHLGEAFDVIVGGELIEHIENPGRFLNNMRSHLAPGGRLILTTPNPFYLLEQLQILLFGRLHLFNAEHVMWYCPYTMSVLAARCKLTLSHVYAYNNSKRIALRLPSMIRKQWASNFIFDLVASGAC